MPIRVHGGIITDQMLSGSLRFFKISSAATDAFENTLGVGLVGAVPNALGAGYSLSDVLTVVGGTGTPATFRVIALSTIATQDETDFAASFAGGTGYSVSDVITMNDGSTITVDAVSSGVITQFTVTTGSTIGITTENATLTQSSIDTAGGSGFTMTLVDANQAVFQVDNVDPGDYTANPANPASTTVLPAGGTGATLDLTFGVIVPGASVAGGNPVTTFEFFVGNGEGVPNSAADRVLRTLSEKCSLVQVSIIDNNNIHIACENTGFAWIDAGEMQTAIQALGTIGAGLAGSGDPPVPDQTNAGTTVDLTSISITEVVNFELA